MIDFNIIKKYFYDYLNSKKIIDSLMERKNDYSIICVDNKSIVFNSKIKNNFITEHFLISLNVIDIDNYTLHLSATIKSPYDINMYNKIMPILISKLRKHGLDPNITNVNTINRYLNKDYEKKMLNVYFNFDDLFFEKVDKLFFIINKYNDEIYDKLMLKFKNELKISI